MLSSANQCLSEHIFVVWLMHILFSKIFAEILANVLLMFCFLIYLLLFFDTFLKANVKHQVCTCLADNKNSD